MLPLSTFYRVPVPVFEPHVENVLNCPVHVLVRLRDEAAIELRRYRDDVNRDRVLRLHARDDLEMLGREIAAECGRLEERVDEVERALCEGVGEPGECAVSTPFDNASDQPVPSEHRVASETVRSPSKGGILSIAACDPPIAFEHDFRGELIDTVFGRAGAWTFSLGAWYYKLKRWLYVHPQWKKAYRISQVDSLSISRELLVAVVGAIENVTVYPTFDCVISDLEAGLCLLAAYRGSVAESSSEVEYGDFDSVIADLPRILRALADDLSNEIRSRGSTAPTANLYGFRDPPNLRYYIPVQNGRHYAPGTFDEHVLAGMFVRRGVVLRLGGHGGCVDAVVNERVTGQARGDPLLLWTRRFLHRRLGDAVPVLVHEQQYLRSGLTTVCALLLLWKVLNAESVFGSRRGNFRLTDVLGDDYPRESETEDDFVSGSVKNFEFLFERYVRPWYARDAAVTVSQLFPGLVLLCCADSVRSGWDLKSRSVPGGSRDGTGAVIAVQSSRSDPVIEYMLSQLPGHRDDMRRLEAHDAVLFHFENGLGRMLSLHLPRHRLMALAGSLFGVADAYEVLYFTVFGFLPTAMVS